MILSRQKQSFALVLLISVLSGGCVSTTDSSSEQPLAETNQVVDAAPNSNLTANAKLQDIQRKIETLENSTEKLGAANALLASKIEEYAKDVVQSEFNSDELINAVKQVQLLELQLLQLKEENDDTISLLKEDQRQVISSNLEKFDGIISEKQKADSANKSAFVELTSQISALNKLVDKNHAASVDYQNSSLYQQESNYKTLWFFLILLFLLTIILLISLIWSRKSNEKKITVANQYLGSELNKFDKTLVELFESQLDAMALIKNNAPLPENHSIPLKVLTEVHRMKNRISSMPVDVKGLKPLEKAVGRIEETLKDKGYEIIELLNQSYIEGMTVNQEYLFDENLNADERIISKVVKPQINFDGVITQVADVIVSIGE
jgi:hypothetical protein